MKSIHTKSSEKRTNLLGYTLADWQVFLTEHGFSPAKAPALLKAIHQDFITDFHQVPQLPKALQNFLAEHVCLEAMPILHEHISQDGTSKWLFNTHNAGAVEVVAIPEAKRLTLCVSSQVGCALDCSFCQTGKQGFNRNLSAAEMISQLWTAQQRMDRKITNIVFMGMGEPLLNEKNLHATLSLMLSDYAYGLSKLRVTVSTSGILPAMKRLKEVSQASLAVSLHATNNALRDELVPINKKYPLEDLLDVCRAYFEREPKRSIVFEYVMLDGINDQPSHAQELIQCLKGIKAKVNLIPFNPFPGTGYQCSPKERILSFRNDLVQAGIPTTIRKTRGDDIAAACGQLAGQVKARKKGI